MTEIKSIDRLTPYCTYATVWKSHKNPHKNTTLFYLTVVAKWEERGLVATSGGYRSFFKLRWFGPFPTKLEDVEPFHR